jgi:hypothetical protein
MDNPNLMDSEGEYDKLPPNEKERLLIHANDDAEFQEVDIELQDQELQRELDPLFSPSVMSIMEVDVNVAENVKITTTENVEISKMSLRMSSEARARTRR